MDKCVHQLRSKFGVINWYEHVSCQLIKLNFCLCFSIDKSSSVVNWQPNMKRSACQLIIWSHVSVENDIPVISWTGFISHRWKTFERTLLLCIHVSILHTHTALHACFEHPVRLVSAQATQHYEEAYRWWFIAAWKTGEDPDNCGEKVFGHDDSCPFEYVQEFLDYISCLYLSHTKLETNQEWAKNDLHPVMRTYKESGKNLIRCVLIVFNWRVIIVNKLMVLVLLQWLDFHTLYH